MGRLQGKVAVVTGGASGMGEATVRLFVAEGAKVVIADIQDEAGQRVAASLGDACIYKRADVALAEDCRALMQSAVDTFGRLDVLFNNAGIAPVGTSILDMDQTVFERSVSINLTAVWLGMKYAIPHMLKGGGGSIISTASIAAFIGLPHQTAYAPPKAAVVQLTRNCAIDFADRGIRVNCICPGGIFTPLSFTGRPNADPAQVLAELATRQPIPRAGLPEDVANVALWLASEESSFVTGQAITVDGGQVASGARRRT